MTYKIMSGEAAAENVIVPQISEPDKSAIPEKPFVYIPEKENEPIRIMPESRGRKHRPGFTAMIFIRLASACIIGAGIVAASASGNDTAKEICGYLLSLFR